MVEINIGDGGAEIWKPVPGYDKAYHISNYGRVLSLKRNRLKILKPQFDGHGYHSIQLSKNGTITQRRVHVLVAEAFIGSKPTGCEVAHTNGKRADNRDCNLRWATHKENASDMAKHGTLAVGTRHGNSKLTDDQVRQILSSDLSLLEIARKFSIRRETVWYIRNRKRWKHIHLV